MKYISNIVSPEHSCSLNLLQSNQNMIPNIIQTLIELIHLQF